MCACVRARKRACVRACVRVSVRACVRACVRVCARAADEATRALLERAARTGSLCHDDDDPAHAPALDW